MQYELFSKKEQGSRYALDGFQRAALGGMFALTILTFVGANLHAVLWQSSGWLVSTVLPSVVVELTNDERSDLGKTSLRRNSVLDKAAQMKAQHMANNQYFAHYAPDGTSPWYWFDQAGYTYAHAGENLAIHFTDSDEVVEAWMKSPTHRANIVNGLYTEIGVGTAKGTYEGYDTVYVVQLFGAPAAAPVVKTTPVVTKTAVEKTESTNTVLAATEEIEQVEVTGIEEVEPVVVEPESVAEVPRAATESVEVLETASDDVVVVARELIATSSGLAVATIVEEPEAGNATSLASLITKPNKVLQSVYLFFGLVIISLLLASVVTEAKRTRYIQVFYGIGLLIVMAGLWYVHMLLTAGAAVV